MSALDYIAPVSALPQLDPSSAANALRSSNAAPAGFGELVTQGIESVNATLVEGQVQMQQLAAGESGNLHQVMLKLEESRLSFQLLMQVRNRLLESYQDVMRMQV